MAGTFYAEGNYAAQIVGQAIGRAKTGTPQIVLGIKILRLPDGSPDPHNYGRTIFWSLTSGTADFVISKLRRIGYQESSFGPFDPKRIDHVSLIGRVIDVYCKHEQYQNGNPRERWDLARAAVKMPEMQPLTNDDVARLDALFDKEPAHASDPAQITDDDIPF